MAFKERSWTFSSGGSFVDVFVCLRFFSQNSFFLGQAGRVFWVFPKVLFCEFLMIICLETLFLSLFEHMLGSIVFSCQLLGNPYLRSFFIPLPTPPLVVENQCWRIFHRPQPRPNPVTTMLNQSELGRVCAL